MVIIKQRQGQRSSPLFLKRAALIQAGLPWSGSRQPKLQDLQSWSQDLLKGSGLLAPNHQEEARVSRMKREVVMESILRLHLKLFNQCHLFEGETI